MRDRFSNWLCSQKWVCGWAETRGSSFAVRLHRLCIARICGGVAIRWAHLSGSLDINDALAAHAARSEGRQHA